MKYDIGTLSKMKMSIKSPCFNQNPQSQQQYMYTTDGTGIADKSRLTNCQDMYQTAYQANTNDIENVNLNMRRSTTVQDAPLNYDGNLAANPKLMNTFIGNVTNGNNLWNSDFNKENYVKSMDFGPSIVQKGSVETVTSTKVVPNYNRKSDAASKTNETNESKSSVESLKFQLQMKETQNESLENEIQIFKSMFKEGLEHKLNEFKNNKPNPELFSDKLEVPHNLEMMFRNLSTALHQKEEELIETKKSLEAILTAVALDPSNSVTKYGRYDVQCISHKMVLRLETLTKENKEMAKMLAYGRSKETQIELQLAKREIAELKALISNLEKKLEKELN